MRWQLATSSSWRWGTSRRMQWGPRGLPGSELRCLWWGSLKGKEGKVYDAFFQGFGKGSEKDLGKKSAKDFAMISEMIGEKEVVWCCKGWGFVILPRILCHLTSMYPWTRLQSNHRFRIWIGLFCSSIDAVFSASLVFLVSWLAPTCSLRCESDHGGVNGKLTRAMAYHNPPCRQSVESLHMDLMRRNSRACSDWIWQNQSLSVLARCQHLQPEPYSVQIGR